MKTTLIFASFILFAAFIGCSDNLNVTEPTNEISHESGQMKKNTGSGQVVEVWKLEELSVYASGETAIAENKAVYTNPPFSMISSYLITFDAYTNANKSTNGFIPLVEILKDGENVFDGSAFPKENGEEVSHFEIKLNNVRFTDLVFYVALIQGDEAPNNKHEAACVLQLSKIRLYTVD